MATETSITCYRHPDKGAGVRCQRCERWICPACLRQASVGFHCPECVAAAQPARRIQPARRTQLSRSPLGRTSIPGFTPVVTYALLALNVVVFAIGELLPSDADIVTDGALIGLARVSFAEQVGVAAGEWYRLVTSGFLHAGLAHLAMNMLFLYLFGPNLERALGRLDFVLVYATSLLAGSFAVMLVDPFSLTVGASGALFGLLGAMLALQLTRRVNPWQSGIGVMILLLVLLSFTSPGVSVAAHVGGLIGGFVAGGAVTWLPARLGTRAASQRAGEVACVAILVALFFGGLWAADYAAASHAGLL